jgi:hypothetical protein
MSLHASKLLLRSGMALCLFGSLVMAACSGETVAVAENGAPSDDGTAGAKHQPEPESDGAAGATNAPDEPGCGEPSSPSPCIDSSGDPPFLECGPLKCNASLQYCLVSYGGIGGDSYGCQDLPLDCQAAPSCACADAPPCGECSDEAGLVVVRCAVP